MVGDRLVYKPEHFKKAGSIMPEIMKCYFSKKLIVTIGGESGIGKSEIADIVQQSLWEDHRIRGKVIHIDDYYLTDWQNRNDIRKKKGITSVGISEIDWDKLNSITKTFKSRKKTIHVQRIHKYTNSIEFVTTDNNSIDVLILEGLYANYLSDKDLGIYLEGTYKDTEKFRKERKKEPLNAFRKKVLVKEHKEVVKTKAKANRIIPYKVKLVGTNKI